MYKRLLSVAIAALVVLVSSHAAVNAATTTATTAGQGLEISPPLVDVKLNPGQTISRQIRLRNVTKETVVTHAQYNDFIAKGEEGQPGLLLNSKEKSPYSIKDWLSTIPSLTLAPGQQKTINFTISAPANASPGGHYGVLRFTAAPPEVDQSAVSLSASVGTLILATVSGDITESAEVVEVYAAQQGKKHSVIEYGPLEVVTRIRNTGNVHIQPGGTVRVTNMLGKEVGTFQINEQKGNVLPASIRKFESTLKKKLMFGRYKLQADVTYGKDQKIIMASGSFWAIPYKLIALFLAAIALIIFLVRRYNRYILKRANKKK